MKSIKITQISTVEYIPNPDNYPSGMTLKQMADYDLENSRNALFSDNLYMVEKKYKVEVL